MCFLEWDDKWWFVSLFSGYPKMTWWIANRCFLNHASNVETSAKPSRCVHFVFIIFFVHSWICDCPSSFFDKDKNDSFTFFLSWEFNSSLNFIVNKLCLPSLLDSSTRVRFDFEFGHQYFRTPSMVLFPSKVFILLFGLIY